MSKKFEQFAKRHRSLLESAIVKYPQHFSPSDLKAFDVAIDEGKKQLKKQGILNEWAPVVSFKKPEDYLYVSPEEIFLESHLGPRYKNLLSEKLELTDAEISKIQGGLKAQINTLKNLRSWFVKLEYDKQVALNQQTQDETKSRNNFADELEDLEEEINGVFGKLDQTKHGAISRGAKKAFGWVQRGLSRAFGGGGISDTSVTTESQMRAELLEKAAPSALDMNSPAASQLGNAIYNILAGQKRNVLSGRDITRLATQYGVSPGDVANVTHRVGGNVPSAMGNLTGGLTPPYHGGGLSTNPLPAPQTPPVTNGGMGIKPYMNSKDSGMDIKALSGVKGGGGKAIAAKAAGMGLGAKLAIAGGIGALVAAGAAGVKLRNRRLRIEKLQKIARGFGARGPEVKSTPLPANEGELEAAKPTSTGPGPGRVTGDAASSPAGKLLVQNIQNANPNININIIKHESGYVVATDPDTKQPLGMINPTDGTLTNNITRQTTQVSMPREEAPTALNNRSNATNGSRATMAPQTQVMNDPRPTGPSGTLVDDPNKTRAYTQTSLREAKHQYKLGLITLKEYNLKKKQIEKNALMQMIKREIKRTR